MENIKLYKGCITRFWTSLYVSKILIIKNVTLENLRQAHGVQHVQ